MLEVADCAEDDEAPVPPDLSLAWQVERWGAAAIIPGPIPVQTLKRINVCSSVYHAFKSYQAGSHRLADWARRNPTHYKIVADIRAMRQEQNA